MTMDGSIVASRNYPMGKAAELLGVHRNTLRRYADQRLIKPHYSRINGRVFFTGQQLLTLQKTGL